MTVQSPSVGRMVVILKFDVKNKNLIEQIETYVTRVEWENLPFVLASDEDIGLISTDLAWLYARVKLDDPNNKNEGWLLSIDVDHKYCDSIVWDNSVSELLVKLGREIPDGKCEVLMDDFLLEEVLMDFDNKIEDIGKLRSNVVTFYK